ncbi:hypothetical protein GGX14DRAFT_432275 [Mycena pura]|uniref:Uncharacterized protein n=1 Tax=Mycena pura TaxID=153505 RepID=A0AAD6VUW5_9AGAR|nr:hypothetical protein GGX14DRAFT_432275 [Mycena pura]
MADQFVLRGREPMTSSGRGGLGNMRAPSTSRDRPTDGPDDFSSTRGREPPVAISQMRSTGRGGSGNFRSPSRDPVDDRDARGADERALIRAHEEREKEMMHSTGRGGVGNMSSSHSRERGAPYASPPPQVHSSGRGGAGNFVPGPPPPYERGRSGPIDGVHSTGRGGLANLTDAPAPPLDVPVHQRAKYESSGRGGVGNMSHSRERSRSASKDRTGIAGLWNRIHGNGHGHNQPAAATIPESAQPEPGAVGGGGREAI